MDQDDAISACPRTNRVTFPYQLHVLLSDAERQGFSNIISWHPSGESFVISQPNDFAKDILPRYFRQTKFSSFKRQLNAYGFQREQTEMLDEFVYSNKPNFIRSSPEACHQIRRRRVIQETNMLSLVEARRNMFQSTDYRTLPSPQLAPAIGDARTGKFDEVDQPLGNSLLNRQFEIYRPFPSLYATAHATRTAEADGAQSVMQQETMQSAIDSATKPGSAPKANQTDPILDDMAASIAFSGDEYTIGEWDPSMEEC
jgi:hypothetical protein